MFTQDYIDEYQIEVTSYCNAACPQCPRNLNGYGINPYMPLVHLDKDVIDASFTAEHCGKLRQVFFCGSYGDPIMHPDFLEILRTFRKKNPSLWLYIHTNGGVHNAAYWQEMARILGAHGQIDFGFDGLSDTLHLYRRNVKYNKAIANASAFINAGGRAQWNFIVFKHNQHQVEQIRTLGKSLGFFNVLVRNTGRFFDHNKVEEMPSWPVQKNATTVEYVLEVPTIAEFRNKSMMFLPKLKQEFPDTKEYFDTTPIKCDALMNKKVVVTASGLVLPCNFFNHNLYDARYRTGVLPGANSLSQTDSGENQVRVFLEKYGLDTLNINKNTLTSIFDSPFWDDLIQSWTSKDRLFECAMTCGSKLTKVWDQGGNPR